MADDSSLFNEIRRLIGIRQSNKALQSLGEIEFVYAEKDAYPFAYIRSSDEERILVIINPSDREVQFPCGYTPKETLYSFGGAVTADGGSITVPAQSAGYYRI